MFQSMEIIWQGGPLMWPILLCSVVAVAIALERFFALRKAGADTREFMDAMRNFLRQGRVQEATDTCGEAATPLARVARAGLQKHGSAKAAIREAMEDAGRLEVPKLERLLSGLATCATVAPLLGLLGTVTGMIKAFNRISTMQGMVSPADLAEGINNALITTAAGLTVAIPTLVMYNYFVSRVSSLVLEMEASASEIADLITRGRDDHEL